MEKIYNYLENHLSEIQAKGKLFFLMNDLKKAFPEYSSNALQMNIKRLSKKNKVRFLMKGFYLIISPEYYYRKVLPPELFIDPLFKSLGRSYYLGLLSASVLHGASHQQAMESYVFINKPALRQTNTEGIKINYIVKSNTPQFGIEKRKTETGYINISGPELTAVDLVEFQNWIGGLNRASTVLHELSEEMSSEKLKAVLQNDFSFSVLQRLGYILDCVLKREELSSVIKTYLKDKKIFRVPLKTNSKKEGFPVHPFWKIIENHKIETDFN
ncbi:MAG: type IV toxin-antitoxin system AbiEi family antitoxin [Ignavibacteria bacterium]